MKFLDLVHDRYSCRKFSDKPVDDDTLNKILEAGIYAPTAKNVQPVKIWVMKSSESLSKIKSCTPFKWTENISVFLLVGGTKENAFVRPSDNRNFEDVDASIVATHLMLAAHDLGLASTWIGFFDVNKVNELFPETKDYDLVAIFPIGYPADDSQPSDRHAVRKTQSEMVKFL